MTSDNNQSTERQVVPSWRSFQATLATGELGSTRPVREHHRVASRFLSEKIGAWQNQRTIGRATDALSAAIALNREQEVEGVAQFLRRRTDPASWPRSLAERALGIAGPINEAEASISSLRSMLKVEARDPITWVELSRVYANHGLHRRAEKSMTVALGLAPDNRFVLRSASRLWCHLDNDGRAHDILVRSERTKHDPWLIAAEVAVADVRGLSPRYYKRARAMIDREDTPRHLSELAAAMATLHQASGHSKTSRRLFGRSLLEPTDNSLAQAACFARDLQLVIEPHHLLLPRAFEAQSQVAYDSGDWESCLSQSYQWSGDQPFSSRPFTMASFVASSVLQDHERALRVAEDGLKHNPKNFLLLNNAAFSAINLGDVSKATRLLTRATRAADSERKRVVLHATSGLLAYRSGEAERGRRLYTDAIAVAGTRGYQDLKRRAAAYRAFEELRSSSVFAHTDVTTALKYFGDDTTLHPATELLRTILMREKDGSTRKRSWHRRTNALPM